MEQAPWEKAQGPSAGTSTLTRMVTTTLSHLVSRLGQETVPEGRPQTTDWTLPSPLLLRTSPASPPFSLAAAMPWVLALLLGLVCPEHHLPARPVSSPSCAGAGHTLRSRDLVCYLPFTLLSGMVAPAQHRFDCRHHLSVTGAVVLAHTGACAAMAISRTFSPP